MTEAILARVRVKPGKVNRLRAWYEELQEREPEVIETLQHEGTYTETAFLHSVNETTYLYIYMEAVELEEANDAGDEELYEIDKEHHAVLEETLTDDGQRLEPIAHFTNPNRE